MLSCCHSQQRRATSHGIAKMPRSARVATDMLECYRRLWIPAAAQRLVTPGQSSFVCLTASPNSPERAPSSRNRRYNLYTIRYANSQSYRLHLEVSEDGHATGAGSGSILGAPEHQNHDVSSSNTLPSTDTLSVEASIAFSVLQRPPMR